MKLRNLLIFIFSLITVFVIILHFFPEKGIYIGFNQKLYLPQINTIIQPSPQEKKLEIASILDEEVAPDTVVIDPKVIARLDSIKKVRMQDSLRKWQLALHYPENNKSILYSFFDALNNSSAKPLRILHYGDSQMEGDRITGYLRNKLQSKFGGTGGGLITPIPICPTPLAMYHYTDNWERFKGFGYRDKRVKHKDYGPNICFAKVTSGFLKDSTQNDSTFEAELILKKQPIANQSVKDWREFKMIYNRANSPFLFELFEDTTRVFMDYLFSENIETFSWTIKNLNLESLRIKISGKISPEILGYSLEGRKGVLVDNIPLRGSSGNIFTSVSSSSLSHFYNQYFIPLVIFQFGGNNMPYLEKKSDCVKYANGMKKNMEYIKSMIPSAKIIMIGPSDMSVKETTDWRTYPMLNICRDELKRATFEAGAIYWDLYEAMGGANSMPLWVDKKLAASDYIHFTRDGARKAASWFYDALINDYEEYMKLKKQK